MKKISKNLKSQFNRLTVIIIPRVSLTGEKHAVYYVANAHTEITNKNPSIRISLIHIDEEKLNLEKTNRIILSQKQNLRRTTFE